MERLSIIHFISLLSIFLGSQVKSDTVDHRYSIGDTVPIYANTVAPYSHPGETYAYYDFPFCSQDAVKETKVSLDKKSNGNYFVLTPYKIEFLVDKQFDILCKKSLSKADVSQFRSVIEKGYRMQFYHDILPIWAFVGRVDVDHGDKIIKSRYFLYNHYDFEFWYNKDRVIKALLQVDTYYMVNVTEDKVFDVEFTYSVKWFDTQQSHDERMEKYVHSSILPQYTSMHGYSIANSSFTILILIIFLLLFYILALRKDISRYACDIEEALVADNQEEKGWKVIHGDVFRFPKYKSLFAAALGSGAQLLVLMVTILILGIVGVFQPHLQGVVLNALAIVYAATSVVSGYTSSSFYHQLEGTRWIKNLSQTGGLYLGPFFLIFGFNNAVAIFYVSTVALPPDRIITLFFLWMFLACPLLLLGAVIGKNGVSNFQVPCRTAKCPKEIPRLRWYRGILPQMALAGFSTFNVIIIPVYDIFNAALGYRIYTSYDSLLIIFFLLLIMTGLVSVMMTYFQLAAEDHQWWWRSFFCGGSTGLYVYGYSIYYYFYLSDMNSFMQASVFFGYMACLSYGIFLVLGTVGFHASLLFVRYLYSSIKCD